MLHDFTFQAIHPKKIGRKSFSGWGFRMENSNRHIFTPTNVCCFAQNVCLNINRYISFWVCFLRLSPDTSFDSTSFAHTGVGFANDWENDESRKKLKADRILHQKNCQISFRNLFHEHFSRKIKLIFTFPNPNSHIILMNFHFLAYATNVCATVDSLFCHFMSYSSSKPGEGDKK